MSGSMEKIRITDNDSHSLLEENRGEALPVKQQIN